MKGETATTLTTYTKQEVDNKLAAKHTIIIKCSKRSESDSPNTYYDTRSKGSKFIKYLY
ncbi:MAG: hypothetical protein ACKPKO_57690 [Candidatus Fonsibacter sp.]